MTDPTAADLDAAEDPLAAATVDLIGRLDAINAERLTVLTPALAEYRDDTIAHLDEAAAVLAAELAYRLP